MRRSSPLPFFNGGEASRCLGPRRLASGQKVKDGAQRRTQPPVEDPHVGGNLQGRGGEYGQSHEDPLIQKFMPRIMRHSKETADKFYRSDEGNQLSLRLANALDGALHEDRVICWVKGSCLRNVGYCYCFFSGILATKCRSRPLRIPMRGIQSQTPTKRCPLRTKRRAGRIRNSRTNSSQQSWASA